MIAPSLPRLRRDPPEPDGDGPFLPPFWPPNPVGEPAYDASCGCEACGCDSDGQWPGYIADSAEDEPPGARKSVPDAQVGDTGQGGKPQGGGGGETVNQVNAALGAAEVAYLDAFLEELVDAVDQGDNDAAWDAYEDYQGLMGQIGATLDHVDQELAPRDESWADTCGNCEVWFADTCGEMPLGVGGFHPSAQPDDPLTDLVREVVSSSFRGDWSECEREVVIAGWNFLAHNFQLAEWALCVATGEPDAGDCVANFLLGVNRLVLQQHACGQLASGYPMGDPWEIVVEILLPWVPHDATPELWLCSGNPNNTPELLPKAAVVYCSGQTFQEDCATAAVAATLLHELTHLCFRNLLPFDKPGRCDIAYLVNNYFLWAVATRFPVVETSTCCQRIHVPGDCTIPGIDGMDKSWLFAPNGVPCLDEGQVIGQAPFVDASLAESSDVHVLVRA